eukprot:gene9737-6824_t
MGPVIARRHRRSFSLVERLCYDTDVEINAIRQEIQEKGEAEASLAAQKEKFEQARLEFKLALLERRAARAELFALTLATLWMETALYHYRYAVSLYLIHSFPASFDCCSLLIMNLFTQKAILSCATMQRQMGRNAAMSAITQRQKREQYLQEFSSEKASDTRWETFIDKEKKNTSRLNHTEMFRILDKVQAQHNNNLVARRKRLAEMLLREREEYDKMLSNLTETDEQRRERLLVKAKALREKRELEKKLDTERSNNRLFREKIDILRQAESRLRVMQVADGRFEQIEAEKQRKKDLEEEEAYFAQQALEAQRLACERSRQDLEKQYLRNQNMKLDLDAQVEGNQMRKEMEKEQKRKDDEEFYRLLHEERVAEAQKTLARKERTKEIAAEMAAVTEELQRARKQEYDRLRQEDKEELDRLLEELADEKEAAAEAKREARAKEWAYMEEVRAQMMQKKANENELDDLWKEANEKEWAKREKVWKADQDRRDKLLHNILVIRRQQVLEKRANDKMARAQRRKEDQEFLDSLPPDDSAERRRLHMKELKELQAYLDMQISEKMQRKQQEMEEKRNALTEQQALEKEFRDRIAQEMANLEKAKPERYKDVPLLDANAKRNMY